MSASKSNGKVLPDIKYLFEPNTIAVVGASSDPSKIGFKVVDNIVSSKFPGKVYPINLRGGDILGHKVYKSVTAISGPIDLCIIVVPAKYVMSTIKQCAEQGEVKHLVIITSGFSEVGLVKEEREMVRFARAHGMRILGPNIFGVASTKVPVNATFGCKELKKGGVAILTQSGALGIALMGKTLTENIGLSAVVSTGNKADIDEGILLEYLKNDENTKVIMVYMEGVTNGSHFFRLLRECTKVKPVVIIKSGVSQRGAAAAASHTGSLAGSDKVFSHVMDQMGVLRAENFAEGLNWARFLVNAPLPRGENTVILTNGGGIGVLATDACEKYNVPLYCNDEETHAIFKDATPDFGSTKNPIDITGQATVEDYDRVLRRALDHKDIDAIITLGCETAVFESEKVAATLSKLCHDNLNGPKPKPISLSFFGGPDVEEHLYEKIPDHVPVLKDVYGCVSCLGSLFTHYRNLNKNEKLIDFAKVEMDMDKMNAVIAGCRKDNRTALLADEASDFMKAAGITMPHNKVCPTKEAAVEFADKVGYPLVMKIVSKDILHKSDAGGVVLPIKSAEEVKAAWDKIMKSCKAYNPKAVITGIEVVEFVTAGFEAIVGARKDASFGPIVVFGEGGIYVEVRKDAVFRSVPFTQEDVASMLTKAKCAPLLTGVRGEKPRDVAAIKDTIVRLGKVIKEMDDIADIEINPLIVYADGKGCRCVDARILLTKKEL